MESSLYELWLVLKEGGKRFCGLFSSREIALEQGEWEKASGDVKRIHVKEISERKALRLY